MSVLLCDRCGDITVDRDPCRCGAITFGEPIDLEVWRRQRDPEQGLGQRWRAPVPPPPGVGPRWPEVAEHG